MNKRPLLAAAVAALGMTSAFAAQDPMENAISARKAAFKLIATNFGPMGAMAKGEMPFSDDVFAKRAINLKALSTMPWEFFVPGSDKGATKAKPEIWNDTPGFNDRAVAFEREVAKLAEAAGGGDQKAMFSQFAKTAKTCKGCHNDFKSKDEH